MTKIYVVKMENRYTGMVDNEYYMSKVKAEKRVEKINEIYENAKAKGDVGRHWGKVTYIKVWIEIVKTKD